MRPSGLVAAAFTPFHDDCSLAAERIGPLVEYYRSRPLGGLFVCGSTGECSTLTDDERREVAAAYVKAARGRLPVIVHAGSSAVASSRALAGHAQSIGADAVAAVAPYYSRPRTREALTASLAAIAAGAPKLPFFFYHIPSLTGVSFPVADMMSGLRETIPNFAGVKFTCEDLMDYHGVLAACEPGEQAFFGRDEILLAGLALGAISAVGSTYNYSARLSDAIIQAFRRGDWDEARRLQLASRRQIMAFLRAGGDSQKITMRLASGIDLGPARLPAGRLSPEAEKDYLAELDAIGFHSWL